MKKLKIILILLMLGGSTSLFAYKAKEIGHTILLPFRVFDIWVKKYPECNILDINYQAFTNNSYDEKGNKIDSIIFIIVGKNTSCGPKN